MTSHLYCLTPDMYLPLPKCIKCPESWLQSRFPGNYFYLFYLLKWTNTGNLLCGLNLSSDIQLVGDEKWSNTHTVWCQNKVVSLSHLFCIAVSEQHIVHIIKQPSEIMMYKTYRAGMQCEIQIIVLKVGKKREKEKYTEISYTYEAFKSHDIKTTSS